MPTSLLPTVTLKTRVNRLITRIENHPSYRAAAETFRRLENAFNPDRHAYETGRSGAQTIHYLKIQPAKFDHIHLSSAKDGTDNLPSVIIEDDHGQKDFPIVSVITEKVDDKKEQAVVSDAIDQYLKLRHPRLTTRQKFEKGVKVLAQITLSATLAFSFIADFLNPLGHFSRSPLLVLFGIISLGVSLLPTIISLRRKHASALPYEKAIRNIYNDLQRKEELANTLRNLSQERRDKILRLFSKAQRKDLNNLIESVGPHVEVRKKILGIQFDKPVDGKLGIALKKTEGEPFISLSFHDLKLREGTPEKELHSNVIINDGIPASGKLAAAKRKPFTGTDEEIIADLQNILAGEGIAETDIDEYPKAEKLKFKLRIAELTESQNSILAKQAKHTMNFLTFEEEPK